MSAPGLKITNFHYSNVTFEKTGFIEFPKWIHMPGYKSVIAKNAEEEAELRARPPIVDKLTAPVLTESLAAFKPENIHLAPKPDANAQHLVGANDEKTLLLQIAKEKNIKVDGRWSLKRLRAEMERAQPAP